MNSSNKILAQSLSLQSITAARHAGIAVLTLLMASCSSGPFSPKTDRDLAAAGPTVVDARAEPATFELNRDLGLKSAEVMANVQDFNSKVSSVKLSFIHVPLEIPMNHVVGNTWRAELTETQLQKLAVDGTTMRYEAYVVARDQNGKISSSPKAITIAVKAPSLSGNG